MARHLTCFNLLLALLCGLFLPLQAQAAQRIAEKNDIEPWRIRFLEAAVVEGEYVLLGEVAVPLGSIPPGKWEELARRTLWPAPQEKGKPVNMTRPRLQEAVMRNLEDLAPYCLFPGSMILQRGGVLINSEAISQMVQSELSPHLAALPGESSLRDFRLPNQIFLSQRGEWLTLEPPRKVEPGRLSLRLLVHEMDGSVRQRYTGSVFIDCFAEVFVSESVLNRDDVLEHNKLTSKRINLASLRGEPWDGRGGPWRMTRPIPVNQVIYQTDVDHIPTVRKGSLVTMLYEGKTVRLTTEVEALADGTAGESILVRNLQSRRELYGTVRDSSTIIVKVMP